MKTIYKNKITFVVLTDEAPLAPDMALSDIEWLITDGPAIGSMGYEVESEPMTDPERIRQELVAIENDGTFFDLDDE